MTAAIVGWAHTKFGKAEGQTVEGLIAQVARDAIQDAGIEARDVDEIMLGHFNAGFSQQDFTAALTLQASDDLRFKPATRVENACATGSAAVHQGLKSIAAKQARMVLVVGVEQMTTTPGPEIGENLLKASYLSEDGDTPAGFAGVFGNIAHSYFQAYGDQSDALAMIAAKNHRNGVKNPYAQIRKDLGYEFCRNREREKPKGGRPAETNRLFACVRWRRGIGAGGLSDGSGASQSGGIQGGCPCAGFPAHVQARYPEVRRLRASLEPRIVSGGCRA